MKARTILQGLSLLLFSVFFVFAAYGLPDWFPADLYLRLDPLLGLNAIIAARELVGRALWSLLLLGSTLLVGRFFCAYVCPMGASIDLLDAFLFGKKARPEPKPAATLRKIKYVALLLIAGAALAGVSFSFFMDPISFLTRVFTFVLYPFAVTVINFLLDLLRPISESLGWIGVSHLHFIQPVFYMSLLTILIFGGIVTLNRLAPRFWCRYLCPLGAFLSLISPLGLFRRRVGKECNECLKCRKNCPMGAIPDDPKATHRAECIQCRTCAGVCPQEAVFFRASAPIGGEYSGIDLRRRQLFSSAAGGLALGLLASRTPFTPLQSKHSLIRPPGAIPEPEFLRTCIRCGECMKSCLTNTLQPCLWESGLTGLWTPKPDLRMSACEQNCNVCGKVCPTQAIRSLSLEEKTHAKMGTAVLRKEMCLVWTQNKLCLICDEICPYNAIVFRPVEGYRRPVVVASKCNGCGFCEQRCPVKGESAIVVVPNGEIRLREGSYVKEAKKLQLEFKADPGDDKFLLDESGFKIDERRPDEKAPPPPSHPEPKKPKGFL
jgi:MauM/NapG family ferredoxin protein